jgi:hypothetical protein
MMCDECGSELDENYGASSFGSFCSTSCWSTFATALVMGGVGVDVRLAIGQEPDIVY